MKWIEVNGIRVYGYHGCLQEEEAVGTWFEADIAIAFDYTRAANDDDLSKTIDYVRVREIAEKQIKSRVKLIETVATNIADVIYTEFPAIHHLKVTVKKFNPPINGEVDHVAVVWEG